MTNGKLVREVKGLVYDVVVDLRKDSEIFGQQFGIVLFKENKTMFYVPEGFVHEFLIFEYDTFI